MIGIATFDISSEKGKTELEQFLNDEDRIIVDKYTSKCYVYIQYKTTYKSNLYPNQ